MYLYIIKFCSISFLDLHMIVRGVVTKDYIIRATLIPSRHLLITLIVFVNHLKLFFIYNYLKIKSKFSNTFRHNLNSTINKNKNCHLNFQKNKDVILFSIFFFFSKI